MCARNEFLKEVLGTKMFLNESEYRIYSVVYTGQVPCDSELDLIFYNSCFISRKDADVIISKKLIDRSSVVLEMFRALDTNFKGYIDLDDLRTAWETTVPDLSWEVLYNSFSEISEDGVLDYEAFKTYSL